MAQRSIPRFVRTLADLELLIVLLAAPALLFPSPTRLLVALAVPAAWACRRAIGQRWIPPTPFNVSLFVLVFMVGVSLFATYRVDVSLPKVAGVILGVLLFWAVVRVVTTQQRMALCVLAFLGAGSVLAVLGLLGTRWFDKFPALAAVIAHLPKAIRGVPGAESGFHPNAVAGCLILFIPLQVSLIAQARDGSGTPWPWNAWWVKGAEALALVLTTGTLLLTQSRGAWTGVLIAGLALMAWHGRHSRAILLTLAVGLVIAAAVIGPGTMLEVAIGHLGPQASDNVIHRVDLWAQAIAAIRDFPITGMGMNTFRTVMPVLYPMSTLSPDLDVAHAHNHFLQAALDLGLPGLIAYVSIWIQAAALLAQVYRRAPDPGTRAVASGLAMGLIAHFTFSMTDAIPLGSKVGVLVWLALAVIAALHRTTFAQGAIKRA